MPQQKADDVVHWLIFFAAARFIENLIFVPQNESLLIKRIECCIFCMLKIFLFLNV